MEKKKLTNRQVKALKTRKKIYDAAEQLFSQYGFDGVSVDAIVEAAGVSKGAFYVYFKSKNDLISEHIADFTNSLDLEYRTYYQSFSAGKPAGDILVGVSNKIVDILMSKMGYNLLKIAYETILARRNETVPIWGYDRDLYKLFIEILVQGVERGEFRKDLPVEMLAKHCIMAIRGAAFEWCIRYPDYDFKKEVEEHIQLLYQGMKARLEIENA